MGLLAAAEQGAALAKSRVVIARDAMLRGTGTTVDSRRMLSLLDRAMQALFDRDNPIETWKKLVRPGETVGLKVNALGGRGFSSNLQLVEAICERLQEAGIKANDIVVWDRDSDELEHAGFHVSTGGNRVQCFGTDRVDYEQELVTHGSVGSRLSKILTQRCNVLINVPVLKDHDGAGVTIALKNMYGVIHNPNKYHPNGCNPYIADLNMLPEIRSKDAIDHLRCDDGIVRRRTGIQAGIQLEEQCPDRFARSGCARLHRLANHRAQASRKRIEDAGRRWQSTALHRDRRRCTASTGHE